MSYQQPPPSPYGQPGPEQQQPFTGYPQQWSQQQPPQLFQQPYQSYPPQYQQQPPFMQQIVIQQPKKSRVGRFLAIGCGSLVALVVLIVVISVAASGHGNAATSSSSNTTNNQQSTAQPTAQPTKNSPVVPKVGDTNTTGNWQVTLHSAKLNQGDGGFNVPKAGNIYLVVDVTMKNIDSTPQAASSIAQWSLVDADGHSYNALITTPNTPDGSVAAGQFIRGNLYFEIPKSQHSFMLQFVPGFDSSQLVQWQVSI